MAVPKIKRKSSGTSAVTRLIVLAAVFLCCLITALYRHDTSAKTIPSLRQGGGDGMGGDSKTPTIGADTADKNNNNKYRGTHGEGVATKEDEAQIENNRINNRVEQDKDMMSLPTSITLTTSQGDIRIKLRPDLSLASVQYIKQLLDDPAPCAGCRFYRAEKPGILQGILTKKNVKKNTVLGDCPEEYKGVKHDCPEHDPHCGCHGPVMKRGMVAWAAGRGGPDFFIDTYIREATWWNNDHTVWGELADKESLDVAMSMYELPTTKQGLTYLVEHVHIELS